MTKPAVLYALKGKRVFVAGHNGMVGSALLRRLTQEDCIVLTAPRAEFDLRRQADAERLFRDFQPQAVFLAAARVGGILANDKNPATFLYDNLMIATNVIEAARQGRVEKLLNLGSTCVYPKFAAQPITEDSLLTGALEPTNQWYAVAKIAAIKLCDAYRRQYACDFISAMPTNLYGPGDNFDLESSHVIPGMMAKFHRAKGDGQKDVTLWGTGKPRREFLYVDDCADALVYLMKHFSGEGPVNVGTGDDLTIAELADAVARTVKFEGRVQFDPTYPDGTPRKLSDIGRLKAMGWSALTSLARGLDRTYRWYRDNDAQVKHAARSAQARN